MTKEEMQAYQRSYYLLNKERMLSNNREYYRKNRDELLYKSRLRKLKQAGFESLADIEYNYGKKCADIMKRMLIAARKKVILDAAEWMKNNIDYNTDEMIASMKKYVETNK